MTLSASPNGDSRFKSYKEKRKEKNIVHCQSILLFILHFFLPRAVFIVGVIGALISENEQTSLVGKV